MQDKPTGTRARHAGIRTRHSRTCATLANRELACTCRPSYEAFAYSIRDGKKLRKTFPTLAAAKGWRHDANSALRKGTMRAPTSTTLREAAEVWLEGAKSGAIQNRSGDPYKPSAIRSYEASLTGRVLRDLGARKLSGITRADLQDLVERMQAEGLDPSTIRNTLMPLRVIYRRAINRNEVAVNPTVGLELPAVRGKRDRIAAPEEIARLLEVLSVADQALWATAVYAGLRRGELMALGWEDIDFAAGLIHVERAWDVKDGYITPKSAAGTRTVPMAKALREYLAAHKLRCTWNDGLVFGSKASHPFTASAVRRRALTAWGRANKMEIKQAEGEGRQPELLNPIGLHECRHAFASFMIAAGVNVKALATYMGHASITITLDRYGHLMPGNEEAAASLLDVYLVSLGR